MRRRDFAVCIALAISVSVVSARTAAADVRQLEPLTANIAARWAFWYVRSHNTLLAAAFGNRPRPINAKLSVPAPGDLRFVQVPGSVTGRILCRFPTTLAEKGGAPLFVSVADHGSGPRLVPRHGARDAVHPGRVQCRDDDVLPIVRP